MKKRFSDEQIIGFLREADAGMPVNDLWGMDFVSDALIDGRRFRALTIVDHFTHECLGIVVDQSLRGEHRRPPDFE